MIDWGVVAQAAGVLLVVWAFITLFGFFVLDSFLEAAFAALLIVVIAELFAIVVFGVTYAFGGFTYTLTWPTREVGRVTTELLVRLYEGLS